MIINKMSRLPARQLRNVLVTSESLDFLYKELYAPERVYSESQAIGMNNNPSQKTWFVVRWPFVKMGSCSSFFRRK
jgi:hypothetical protein